MIVVNTNADAETSRLIGELVSQKGPAVRAVIVHNGDHELRVDLPEAARSRVWVVRPPHNRGYFSAANFGLEDYLSRNPMPEWVVVSNADVHIPDSSFFDSLARFYRTAPPGLVAPSILSLASQRDQNPNMRRRPSRARMWFYRFVFQFFLTDAAYHLGSIAKARLRRWQSRTRGTDPPARIYAAHGAFMIFNRSYFDAGGSLRYDVFLYGEEVFVAETARSLGLEVRYDPRLRVVHSEHSETGAVINPKSWRRRREASAHIARRFF